MITATPAHRPSMLSIRLNAFVIPAIHKKVRTRLAHSQAVIGKTAKKVSKTFQKFQIIQSFETTESRLAQQFCMPADKKLPVIEKRRILDFRRRPRPCVRPVSPTKRAERIEPMALGATDRAHGPFGEPGDARPSDQVGTLIRHARPTVPFAVAALANKVSVPARFSLLVSTVGIATLPPPGRCAALRAAIPLTNAQKTTFFDDRQQ